MTIAKTSSDSVKLKKAGVGANFCMHKYFFDKSESWKAVLAEEREANQDADGEEDVEDDGQSKLGVIRFDPIDARHLSSLPLIKGRLEKLLRNSPHHMHRALNLVTAIVRVLHMDMRVCDGAFTRAFLIPTKPSAVSFRLV